MQTLHLSQYDFFLLQTKNSNEQNTERKNQTIYKTMNSAKIDEQSQNYKVNNNHPKK